MVFLRKASFEAFPCGSYSALKENSVTKSLMQTFGKKKRNLFSLLSSSPASVCEDCVSVFGSQYAFIKQLILWDVNAQPRFGSDCGNTGGYSTKHRYFSCSLSFIEVSLKAKAYRHVRAVAEDLLVSTLSYRFMHQDNTIPKTKKKFLHLRSTLISWKHTVLRDLFVCCSKPVSV